MFFFRSFIEVHGRPGAPVFTRGPDLGQEEEKGACALYWSTPSTYPILEYRILFKKVHPELHSLENGILVSSS
jgi:hypothetical protein